MSQTEKRLALVSAKPPRQSPSLVGQSSTTWIPCFVNNQGPAWFLVPSGQLLICYHGSPSHRAPGVRSDQILVRTCFLVLAGTVVRVEPPFFTAILVKYSQRVIIPGALLRGTQDQLGLQTQKREQNGSSRDLLRAPFGKGQRGERRRAGVDLTESTPSGRPQIPG